MVKNMKRFKLKMVVVLAIGAFTTFTMLLYATSESGRCDSTSSILCFYVYKDEGPASKNVSFHALRDKTGTGGEIRHYFISKTQVYNFKFKTSGDFRRLRFSPFATPKNVTSSDNFRTRRNVYFSSRAANFVQATSVDVAREGTTKALPRANATKALLSKNDNNSNDTDYLQTNLINLLSSSQLNLSLSEADYSCYKQRQKNLVRVCENNFNSSNFLNIKSLKLNHILIDESRKVLFCYVPKVACTNWKRIFMLLTGKASNLSEAFETPSYKVHVKNLFTTLENYSLPEVNNILRDYTKFIFVRNPFERLLSAYRNKLEQHYDSSKYFQARFGKYIVRKFRKNPSNVSLERGDDVTFSEFVDYLVSSDSSSYNEHWQTVTNLCHPCYINYDFIGKYETLMRDSNFVLKYLKMNFTFPVLEKPSRTASSLNKYFNNISKEVIYKLYSIYQMDFKLFDYDLHKTLNISDTPSTSAANALLSHMRLLSSSTRF